MIRTGSSTVCVRSTLGGKGLSGSGQTTWPSSATSYGNRGVTRKLGDVHERVVVAFDGEGALARGGQAARPDLDRARRGRLHPHGGLVGPRVAEQRPEMEVGQAAATRS